MSSNPKQWQNQWQLDRNRGLLRTKDTATVLAHIEWLLDQGFSCTAIAIAAGVDRGTVLNIRSGKNRMITTKTEKKIMAVTPRDIYARSDKKGYVPSVGAVRRLQALMVMGWRYEDLRPRLGFSPDKICQGAGWVGQHHHEAIVRLYDELWDKKGPASKAAITKALSKGWHRPMAWDDDTIDDPNAVPFGTERRAA